MTERYIRPEVERQIWHEGIRKSCGDEFVQHVLAVLKKHPKTVAAVTTGLVVGTAIATAAVIARKHRSPHSETTAAESPDHNPQSEEP